MNYIILGIDPGIADTGWGVIKVDDCGDMSCIDYGSIKTKAGLKLSTRLEKLNSDLDKIIEKYRPDFSAVEELYFCNNAKTALIVGQARGVIMMTLCQHKIPIKEFTPLQVKQAVSSYGKASKDQVQRMVQVLLKLKNIPKSDDAADALAIAICASSVGIKK
jgi:crossover junction endodeoxyribonuclease RuvC